MRILIFPSKIWAKKCALHMAKYGRCDRQIHLSQTSNSLPWYWWRSEVTKSKTPEPPLKLPSSADYSLSEVPK